MTNMKKEASAIETDLSWLMHPTSTATFADQYWGRRFLRVPRNASSYYSQLLSESELEFSLFMASKVPGAVELLSENDTTENCHSHAQALSGFRQGKSIRIGSIQSYSYPIMMLCRNLERAINCPINVNMYLSPGSGEKALKRHYDTHDVFVLQVHGNKDWRLYDPAFVAPLEFLPLQRHESVKTMQRFRLRSDMSGSKNCVLSDEFTLEAGDCLYLPRGVWHEAESRRDEISCHLTVGVQPTTYLDVLNVALSTASNSDHRLRESLPFGFATDASALSSITAHVATIAKDIPQLINPTAALDELTAHLFRMHTTGFENDLLQRRNNTGIEDLNGSSHVRVRNGLACIVSAKSSPAEMRFSSKVFAISDPYEAACRFITKVSGFTIGELPGNLSLPQQVVLVHQLISEGLLAPAYEKQIPVQASVLEPKWVPVRLNIEHNSIQWVDLKNQTLVEPFLHQTVNRLCNQRLNLKTRATDLSCLEMVEEELVPSGFIFHISRCGSTLLSNGLKALPNAVIISEPQPIGAALESMHSIPPDATEEGQLLKANESLLRGLVKAYGQKYKDSDNALVIKFSSWNILYIETIRRLWPEVPCVIVIRDPVEVAVSCLSAPPGWMARRMEQKKIPGSMLHFSAESSAAMSNEGYCARMLGEFLKCASMGVQLGCNIIDYQEISHTQIEKIANLFRIAIPADGSNAIRASISTYSKDPHGQRLFIDDRKTKQASATAALRRELDRWAMSAYEQLRLVRQ
jgi:ribosomal protein L16 Arg81 hydroxylase